MTEATAVSVLASPHQLVPHVVISTVGTQRLDTPKWAVRCCLLVLQACPRVL